MDPIATYTERLLQVRRTFTLYDDKVVVDAHWLLRGHFRSTIPLASLTRDVKEHYIRNKLFKTGGLIAAVGVILVAWTVYPRLTWPPPIVTIIGAIIAIVGLVLSALTYPKVLFVHFETREGKPALDIGRVGPDKARFNEFIMRIRKQIRKQ